MRDDLNSAYTARRSDDATALLYQRQLSSALQRVRDADKHILNSEPVQALRDEWSSLRTRALQQDEARVALEEKLAARDRSLAAHTADLATFRDRASQLPMAEARVRELEMESRRKELSLRAEMQRSETRATAAEENVRVLNEEIVRLSAALTRARCDGETVAASNSAEVRAANETAAKARDECVALKAKLSRTELTVTGLKSEGEKVRAAADEIKRAYDEEIVRLKEMVDLHANKAKQAEQRAKDFEELVASYKEEAEERARTPLPKGKINQHTEVLLKTLEDAVRSRSTVMQQQRTEMERAREAELAMLSKQTRLEREARDARFDAEQARKELVRLRRQVEAQAGEMTRLRRQTEALEVDHPVATPGVFADDRASLPPGMGVGMGRPSSFGTMSGRPTHSVIGRPSFPSFDLRPSSQGPMDIGPQSIIPTDYLQTPVSGGIPDDIASTMREMSEIRKRHEAVLQKLQENRISFG